MKIIISPAKKMNRKEEELSEITRPVFYEEACQLREELKKMDFGDLKALWNCNEKIAEENQERLRRFAMDQNLTGAVLAYEGIQYQYMAPAVFGAEESEYIQEHLRILSGFYGVLKPFDGVVPYRLEMQAKASDAGDLYRFWGGKLYREVVRDDTGDPLCGRGTDGESRKGAVIVNLASKEYSRCIEKYIQPEDAFITVTFGELVDRKVKQKGTYAKMARGEMVRYLAELQAEEPDKIKGFDRLGYRFAEELSTEKEYVFLKQEG